MFKTNFLFSSLGKTKNLSTDLVGKIITVLEDNNPHMMFVLNKRRFYLISASPVIKVHKSVCKTSIEFEELFELKATCKEDAKDYLVLELHNSEIGELEMVGYLLSAYSILHEQTQEPIQAQESNKEVQPNGKRTKAKSKAK